MKQILFVIFTISFLNVNSQSINNLDEKTDSHILIKGTNVFLIPPIEYLESSNFKGFQNPNDQTSMIMLIEIPGPFNKVSEGFNKETLLTRGMKLNTKKEIKVNNFDGYLIDLEQQANGLTFSKTILVFGDKNKTTLINGVYLKDSISTGEKLNKSILSTYVDNKLKSNPRKELSYSLNESDTDMKFLYVMGNGMLFNRDKKTPTESIDKATLITDKSFEKKIIKNKKLFCISRIKKMPEEIQIIPSKGINEIEIDNLKGFELYAKSLDNSNKEIYQVILFEEDGGYFLFFGSYLAGNKKAIENIKSLIKTFKRN